MSEKSCAPLILLNKRIYNYAQFLTEIEYIKKKYSRYSGEVLFDDTKGCKVEVEMVKGGKFCFEDVIESYFEQNVRSMVKKEHRKIKEEIIKKATAEIKTLERKENRKACFLNKINVSSINFLQNWVKNKEDYNFSNPFLMMGAQFLKNFKGGKDFENEKKFLEQRFIDYIIKFLKENGKEIEKLNYKDIKEFVRLKYDREEFLIETYEGRYPFAELYVLFRCGMTKEINNLISEGIFKILDIEFENYFIQYFRSGKVKIEKLYKIKDEDKFKIFFYKLMSRCYKGEGDWILTTFEDFLWYQLLDIKGQETAEINKLFNNIENDSCRLLVALLTKSYSKCYDILTTGKFSILEVFFFSKLLFKAKKEDNFILEVIFIIAKEFTSTERKILLIESIKEEITNYKEKVSEFIVKYSMFDILGLNNKMCLLDVEIGKKVANILKKKKDRRILIQLYYLLDDEELIINLLNESLSEIILSNNINKYNELEETIEYFERRSTGRGMEIMNILRGFIKFMINPTDEYLRRTGLFDESKFIYLEEIKLVTEKIIIIACKLIKNRRERNISKNIIKVCSYLYKGKECSREISECLITLL